MRAICDLPLGGVEVVQPAAIANLLRLLPSTQFIDAFRGIAMHGIPLADFSGWILALGCWTVAATVISARYFRWV